MSVAAGQVMGGLLGVDVVAEPVAVEVMAAAVGAAVLLPPT